MATLFEQQQQQAAQQAAQQQKVGAVTGAIVQTIGRGLGYRTNILATAIELIGGVGIGLAQFFGDKKQAAVQEKQTAHQQFVTDNVDKILDQLNQAGLDLIDQDLNPLKPEFETTLYQNLYQTIGYQGNCNATIWFPGSQPGLGRQIWFQITNNGSVLVPTSSLQDPPVNLETYWSTKCKNVHDNWYNAYQDKLITEGRNAELAAFQSVLNKGRLIWQISFGVIISILVIIVFMNMMRIK